MSEGAALKARIMDLVAEYAQETKDFGHLDDSLPRKALSDSLESLITEHGAARKTVLDWMVDNGPNGWIEELRKNVDRLTAERNSEVAEAQQDRNNAVSEILRLNDVLQERTAERDDLGDDLAQAKRYIETLTAERNTAQKELERYMDQGAAMLGGTWRPPRPRALLLSRHPT